MRVEKWEWEISNKGSYWSLKLKEIWGYRHLLASYIKRDFLINYQQTVLGPLWILFNPLLTLAIYVLVFSRLIGVSTGTMPPVLFYFSGIVLWNCFNDIFSGTSNTLRDNYHIFSKVYFPRIIVPISVTGTQFLRLLIQLALFFLLIGYYCIFRGFRISFTIWSLAFPVAILFIAVLSLGLGLIFSIITAKYRDINNLVMVGIRLLMFVTPVFYPVTSVSEKARWVVQINPLTPLFELFRFSVFGQGIFTTSQLTYSIVFMLIVFITAMVIFNKQCDKLIDVV